MVIGRQKWKFGFIGNFLCIFSFKILYIFRFTALGYVNSSLNFFIYSTINPVRRFSIDWLRQFLGNLEIPAYFS